jgi:hypothetical protein
MGDKMAPWGELYEIVFAVFYDDVKLLDYKN